MSIYSAFKDAPNSKRKTKTREVDGDASLLSLKLYVLLAVSSHLSVLLKLCIMNTLLHFLLCQLCGSLTFRNKSLGGQHIIFPGLIKRSYHDWLSIMTSSEDSPFQPCLGPPTPKSSTECSIYHKHFAKCLRKMEYIPSEEPVSEKKEPKDQANF